MTASLPCMQWLAEPGPRRPPMAPTTGQTVNVASRIADYAGPGDVIVSQEVVDASAGAAVVFREVGPVELKGVTGAMRLHAASLPG
jgi:adenylate cyclase